MKTLNPNNRNPSSLKHNEMMELIMEEYQETAQMTVGVGHATVAFIDTLETFQVKVRYHDTVIAILHDEETVSLYTGGFMTETTKRRLDWVLLPLGYRMVSKSKGRRRWGQNHDAFKVYRIEDGMYFDFHEGMTLVKK